MATPDQLQRNLGMAVKTLRSNLGITQEELSNRTGVHPTYISDVERGARNPSWAALVKLVHGMNATMAELGDAFDRIEVG
ncbi:MAG TPA: helix-turn-helix transcriptional regulator [Solirubrobacteraceae bacterium]|nr:helix-turn-helix transcriptional regulator [Solirubrobacteraceae bacterium]